VEFDNFFDRLKTHQEQSLWNNGLTRKWHSGIVQFALTNFGYTKSPSKIGQGTDCGKLIHEVTLRIKDGKNTIQIKDERKTSSDGKYDGSQVINKEETDSNYLRLRLVEEVGS